MDENTPTNSQPPASDSQPPAPGATVSQPTIITSEMIAPGAINQRHLYSGNSAKGDVYYGLDGVRFSELKIGTTGQTLTVVNGLPAWASASGTYTGIIIITSVIKGLFDNGTQKGTYNIDWSKGDRQKIVCDHTGNLTLTYSNAAAGQVLTLNIDEDSTGGSSITLPTSKWPNGVAGTFITTASALNTIVVLYDGTNYRTQAGMGWA